jgi:hypothetical protein
VASAQQLCTDKKRKRLENPKHHPLGETNHEYAHKHIQRAHQPTNVEHVKENKANSLDSTQSPPLAQNPLKKGVNPHRTVDEENEAQSKYLHYVQQE